MIILTLLKNIIKMNLNRLVNIEQRLTESLKNIEMVDYYQKIINYMYRLD